MGTDPASSRSKGGAAPALHKKKHDSQIHTQELFLGESPFIFICCALSPLPGGSKRRLGIYTAYEGCPEEKTLTLCA